MSEKPRIVCETCGTSYPAHWKSARCTSCKALLPDVPAPDGQREEAERAEFEAWAKDQGWDTEMYDRAFYTGLNRDTYKDSRTDDGWHVWLAGRAALRASGKGEV